MADEKNLIVAPEKSTPSVFQDMQSFEFAQRASRALASSELVPERYRIAKSGESAVANCMIAMDMANRVGMNVLMIMQNLYVVHGNPGWSAQYIRAAINTSSKFSIPQYEFFGKEGTDEYGCKAFATINATGEKIYGPKVTVKMAKAEGWWSKNGSKWPNMTDLMLQNRAITFFGRTYCPEALMGMKAAEELDDIVDINPVQGQTPMTRKDIQDALVGDVVMEPVGLVPDKGQPEKAPEPAAEPASKAAPGQTAQTESPFTADELIERIQAATTFDTINDALSLAGNLETAERKRVMKSASEKNKTLVAERDKK